jgi:hypothetical protein
LKFDFEVLHGDWAKTTTDQSNGNRQVNSSDFPTRFVNSSGVLIRVEPFAVSTSVFTPIVTVPNQPGTESIWGTYSYSVFRDVNGDGNQNSSDRSRISERSGSKLFGV